MREALCSFQSLIAFACTLEKEKIRMYRAEYENLPKGSLYLNKTYGKTYFEQALDGKRRVIGKDQELIYQLARKRYLGLKIKSYEKRFCADSRKIRIADQNYDFKIRKLLERYGDAGLDVMRVTCTKQQYDWAHEEYERNTYKSEELRYTTYSGIRVRSKSERDIGNELELNGVPYRYEQLVNVFVGWMENVSGGPDVYRNYYPDFLILTVTGDYIIWEHLGRVDLEYYRLHNAEKICALREGEGIREEMFIMTFEKDLEESGNLQRLIARRVLPYV